MTADGDGLNSECVATTPLPKVSFDVKRQPYEQNGQIIVGDVRPVGLESSRPAVDFVFWRVVFVDVENAGIR